MSTTPTQETRPIDYVKAGYTLGLIDQNLNNLVPDEGRDSLTVHLSTLDLDLYRFALEHLRSAIVDGTVSRYSLFDPNVIVSDQIVVG